MNQIAVGETIQSLRSVRLRRPLSAILIAVAALLALDALIFRTGLYTSILEPDSSTGLFELILRREHEAQSRHGRNLVVTLGDSRFAYYPRVANEQTAATGFAFRSAGVAGTNARAWYYMLRDLDPTRDRYRAIVFGVEDYDDEDGAYDISDDLATLHYVAARLRLTDVIPFTLSFHRSGRSVGSIPWQPVQRHRVPARYPGVPLPSGETPGRREVD